MLPDLGVGLVFLPGLGSFLDDLDPRPDVIEVEPQAFWSHPAGGDSFQLNLAHLDKVVGAGARLLVHSVGNPVGGLSDGDPHQIPALRETLAYLKPPWWSDHASFVWAGMNEDRRHLGFLMPPVQSSESVRVIADRIRRLQDAFGLPFAFETGANYLRPRPGEWPDGAFWGAIADQADCGILLDLHNIWTNAANGREPVAEIVAEIPLDRVWEVHVAGGQSHKGFWLDSHSGLPPDGLLRLAADTIPKLPNLHAIILEIIPDYIPANDISADDISACLAALREIWMRRVSKSEQRPDPTPVADRRPDQQPPTMHEWERSLEVAISSAGREQLFQDDPGIPVYRDLIAMARRGMVVEALPMSVRYLLGSLGEDGLSDLFSRFWGGASLQPFMSDEAASFAEFVRKEVPLPYLTEVLDFELAAHQAAITGRSQYVAFSCEPEPLFRSLLAGNSALDVRPADVQVEVEAPRSV